MWVNGKTADLAVKRKPQRDAPLGGSYQRVFSRPLAYLRQTGPQGLASQEIARRYLAAVFPALRKRATDR